MYHHLPTTVKPIIGKKILKIERLKEDKVRVFIKGDKEEFFDIFVVGDCCSRSIFYGIVFPPEAVGQEILSIEEGVEGHSDTEAKSIVRNGPYREFVKYVDVLSVWDIRIKTSGGDVLINHINNSNGYYDGMTSYSELEEVE